MERSFAIRIFNRYETEINEHFWSFKVISEHARYIAEKHRKEDPEFSTGLAFHASGPDAGRIPPTVTEWLDARKELENWLRLSALVSATAYHETYLRQIIRSALMASPLLRLGSPHLVEGTVLLKAGKELPFSHEIEMITKGDWNTRSANYVKLFGWPYPGKPFAVQPLEKIRKLRNEFAHGFGRDLDPQDPSVGTVLPAKRLTHEKFLEYIGILSKSAAQIDRHLLGKYIGNFELIHCYHEWKTRSRSKRDFGLDEAKAFQRYLHGQLSFSINRDFCRDLIAFYNAA